MPKILLVEDDPAFQFTIQTALEANGYSVDAVSTTADAIERLADQAYPIVVTDIYIDERTGLDVLDAAKRKDALCCVILMTGRGTIETVMKATRGGAFDYIAKPFELDVLLDAISRAEDEHNQDEDESEEEEPLETEMIGTSPSMVEVYKTVSRTAPTDATVIIEGETGTGKDLVARMIHRFSLRKDHPFVPGLRRHRPLAARKRIVRRHARRFHRRRPRPRGCVRSRQPRHRFPRRNRRYRTKFPIGAAAFPGKPRDHPGGRFPFQNRGRARAGRHQPRPAADGE